MANYFYLTLDTNAPSNPLITLAGGAQYTSEQVITATISTDDGDTTGYQIKIWGDVDDTYDGDIQSTEGSSAWISYTTSKSIKLSSGDGTKTIYLKIRDDVWNETTEVSDSIILDASLPTVTTTAPDVSIVSKISGKDTCSFSFSVDCEFVEYVVKVVPAENSLHDAGTAIPTTNGSANMADTGTFDASTPINCQIKGADLELASSGDGQKIVKVFVKESSGNWSV